MQNGHFPLTLESASVKFYMCAILPIIVIDHKESIKTSKISEMWKQPKIDLKLRTLV
jgi:hypothetical protein